MWKFPLSSFLVPALPVPRCARASLSVAAASVVSVWLLAGCASGPPQGDSQGRIDSYTATESDKDSAAASIPAMLEFSDQTVEQLARELSQIPEIAQAEKRVVLELGTIENKTRTRTSDFEQLQRRLRSQIISSKLLRQHFLIVESRQRIDQEIERVRGADESGRVPASARYSPQDTYVLQGDFFESVRGSRRQYFFNFKLTHLASRAIVFDSMFDLGQVRK